MLTSLTNTEARSLSAISVLCVVVIGNAFQGDGEPLVASLAFSGLAFSATFALIRWLGPVFLRAGWKGKDMSKANQIAM